MKNRGCSLAEPWMVKVKSSENFLLVKIFRILTFRGPADQGVWKVAIFTAKGTLLHESVVWAIRFVYRAEIEKWESLGLP